MIAEVYTPGLAFLSVIVLLLWHWQVDLSAKPCTTDRRAAVWRRSGCSRFCGVDCPGGGISRRLDPLVAAGQCLQWRRGMGAAFLGLVAGIGIYLLAFLLIDINNPPSSFYQVALVSSRSIWGLSAANLDTSFERFSATVAGLQWQDAMFPGGDGFFIEARVIRRSCCDPRIFAGDVFVCIVGTGSDAAYGAQARRLFVARPCHYTLCDLELRAARQVHFLSPNLLVTCDRRRRRVAGFLLDLVHRHGGERQGKADGKIWLPSM